MKERKAELLGHGFEIEVIADDQRDLGLELSHPVPQDDVVEAVDMFRDKEGHPGLHVGEVERALHVEFLGQRIEGLEDLPPGDVEALELPLDPHEEDLGALRRVLGGVNDVAAVAEDEVRHRGDDPLLVGAGQQQDGVGFHGGHILEAVTAFLQNSPIAHKVSLLACLLGPGW